MLTQAEARNFQYFEDVEIALGNPMVLIGPNNSGKTTVLQALVLWTIGLQRWQKKRLERQSQARKRPGVTINRQARSPFPISMPCGLAGHLLPYHPPSGMEVV